MSIRKFKVDARALISLGRESIKDHTTALIELVKNSYDADASNVEIEISIDRDSSQSYIRIADDGIGMSSSEINSRWLRIGFSDKRKNRVSDKGRRETGEKGIGRLSADRLGAVLELRTQALHEPPVGIRVNWNDFDVDGEEIGAVAVHEIENAAPFISKRKIGRRENSPGTEILIMELRQDWSEEDVENLELELATLVPPAVSKSQFKLWMRAKSGSEFQLIVSAAEAAAELDFTGVFDGAGRLKYEISARPISVGQKRRTVKVGTATWAQLVHPEMADSFNLGKMRISLAFYLRSTAGLSGALTLTQLREFLNTQAGVRIYRDDIRVKPYGDHNHAEGDWLGLSERKTRDPAGAARSSFKIAGNQLIGSVEIGRDSNPNLADSAAREGLIHGPAYAALKASVYSCISLLEQVYHEKFVDEKVETTVRASTVPAVVDEISIELAGLTKDLAKAEKSAGVDGAALLKASSRQLAVVAERFEQAKRDIEELANQNIVYRGLATVGISTAVFGHETEGALAQAKLSASLAAKCLKVIKPDLDLARVELAKLEKAIAKVGVWGQFALSRVKRDKRRRTKVDLSKTIMGVITEVNPLFNSASISLETNIEDGIELRAFVMDIEALVLNLLTNAYHHASVSRGARRVLVSLGHHGRFENRSIRLSVSDSGSGIAKEHLKHIWTPLFSTKIDKRGRSVGTGLGLTIVRSIVLDIGAEVSAVSRGVLGGASFQVVIPSPSS